MSFLSWNLVIITEPFHGMGNIRAESYEAMSSAIIPVNFRAPIFWKLLDPLRSGRNVDDDDHKSLFDFSSRKSSFLCYLE